MYRAFVDIIAKERFNIVCTTQKFADLELYLLQICCAVCAELDFSKYVSK